MLRSTGLTPLATLLATPEAKTSAIKTTQMTVIFFIFSLTITLESNLLIRYFLFLNQISISEEKHYFLRRLSGT